MRTLLDEILDATAFDAGPVILREEHDVRKIDWRAAAGDVAELGGRAGIEGAIRRAALDTSNGRVNLVVAGDLPWHKLGVNVRDALTSADAARLGGLTWQVEKRPLSYRAMAGGEPMVPEMFVESPDAFATVRGDTQKPLGTVGRTYEPIQNAEAFRFVDAVLAKFGARYEAAGSLYGGAKVFMLVKIPDLAFKVGAGDWTEAFGLFTNAHDGSEAGRFLPTSVRVVCNNTRRIARAGALGKGVAFRHTKNVRHAMTQAERALADAAVGFREYAAAADAMARAPLPDVQNYLHDVLDAVLDVTQADAMKGADLLAATLRVTEAERELARKSFARKIERRGELLADMLERYESETCGADGQRGTVWAAYNAVTEAVDHGPLGGRFVGGEDKRASSRFDSVIAGRGDDVKQAAYDRAAALAT